MSSKFGEFFSAVKSVQVPQPFAPEPTSRIKVFGIGGGGGNAVSRMIEMNLSGVEFCALNTDVQALSRCHAPQKLSLGETATRGLGAGGDPMAGLRSAEENRREIRRMLEGVDMAFITAGMGGGTGTGAAPVVAQIAAEMGILTVAVVTKPFRFEGPRRARLADEGIKRLSSFVDTIIVVPNDKLLQLDDRKVQLEDAFKLADDILRQAVQGVSDIITVPGMINVDFADVRAIISGAGSALLGIGVASGPHRAVEAAERAISSPLLERSLHGAKRVLVNVSSDDNLMLDEFTAAAELITNLCDANDANIILGWVPIPGLKDEVRVTGLATGFDDENTQGTGVKAASQPMVSPPSSPAPDTAKPTDPPARPVEQSIPPPAQSGYREVRPANPQSGNGNGSEITPAGNDLDIPTFLRNRS